MSEKKYKKRLDIQNKMVARQSEQIEKLKNEIINLKLELQDKDEIINSLAPLREEYLKDINELKNYKKEYGELVGELRKMKKIVNQEIYRGRWKIVRWIINL